LMPSLRTQCTKALARSTVVAASSNCSRDALLMVAMRLRTRARNDAFWWMIG
jgi:hypothetical protein